MTAKIVYYLLRHKGLIVVMAGAFHSTEGKITYIDIGGQFVKRTTETVYTSKVEAQLEANSRNEHAAKTKDKPTNHYHLY